MLKDLNVQIIPQGVLLPPKKDSSKSWGLGGVVDSNGSFVEDSVYRFYFGGYYEFDKNEVQTSDEEVIYLGHLIPHWGVFLVDFTRRLWYYYKANNPNLKLAFFGVNMPGKGFDGMHQMYHDFFQLADIDEANVIDIQSITRFKTVYLPEMGYDEDKEYYSLDYLLTFNRVIDNLNKVVAEKYATFKTYPKVYLSRTKFATFREAGENIIEQFFALNGFEIVHPEELDFIQKVLIFKYAEVIASIEGTTAHQCVLFSRNASSQIIIRKQKWENLRQQWFNMMKNVPCTVLDCYYEPIPGMPYSWDEGPFLMLLNRNVKKYAKENGMVLPKGIIAANIKAILHYLHIALIHFLQRHSVMGRLLVPVFGITRIIKSKRGK